MEMCYLNIQCTCDNSSTLSPRGNYKVSGTINLKALKIFFNPQSKNPGIKLASFFNS